MSLVNSVVSYGSAHLLVTGFTEMLINKGERR